MVLKHACRLCYAALQLKKCLAQVVDTLALCSRVFGLHLWTVLLCPPSSCGTCQSQSKVSSPISLMYLEIVDVKLCMDCCSLPAIVEQGSGVHVPTFDTDKGCL